MRSLESASTSSGYYLYKFSNKKHTNRTHPHTQIIRSR